MIRRVSTRSSTSSATANTVSSGNRRPRRTLLIRIVTLVALAGVVATFLAVVAKGTNGRTTTNIPEKPVRGGSITDDVLIEPDSLLPEHYQFWAVAPIVDAALWAPLWYVDPQGILHPGIAKDIASPAENGLSPDLTTWTFHLRPGLRWSDGSPETAEDCAWSFNLYANPAFANTNGFPTTDPGDPVGFVSATAVDTTTVVLKIRRPYEGMLYVLVDSVSTCLQKAHYSQIAPADFATSSENTQPQVTNGPFNLKEWVHGDHLTFVRNPYYYQGPDKPYLDQITFKFITDASRLLPALQTHLLDAAWQVDFTQIDSFRAIPGYTTYVDRFPMGEEFLLFNLSDPILSDHAVRQALTMSFDISQLPQQLFGGAAQLTCDDSSGNFAHEAKLVPCYHFDPHAAAQLLDADGWMLGADGIRHKKGQILELSYVTNARPWRVQTQALAQTAWQAIGIKIDLQSSNDFQRLYCAGQFQIGEVHDNGNFDPDDHLFLASDQTCDKGGGNWMHYANPTVDAAERIQQTTADIATRQKAFHTVHEEVLKDLPVMYLWTTASVGCAISTLRNYDPIDPVGGPGDAWNVWDWYLSPSL